MGAGTVVVKRATGFVTDFAFLAEMTFQTADGGTCTVREGGHTEDGARMRVEAAARTRLTSRKHACGFTADGFRDYSRNKATFRTGF